MVSKKLAEVATRRLFRLIVTLPPRHGKSSLISEWFPVWYLENWPDHRVVLTSYEADFAAHWGRRVRDTIAENKNHLSVRISDSSSAANRWETTKGGGMFTAGVGGPLTGRGADVLIVDDPVKNAEEADSQTFRDRAWEWWTTTAYTRLEPNGVIVVVQTRWHEDDLAGRLLAGMKTGGEQYEVVNLPALAEGEDALGRAESEALWPARYPRERLLDIKRAVGSRAWAALYQQRPAPEEGNLFKREWWKSYLLLPERFDDIVISFDCAFKGKDTSDFVVGQVWGVVGAQYYLIDQIRARMDFPTTLRAVRHLAQQYPFARAKLIEDKANGPAVVDTLVREIPGVIAVDPRGGKEARAAAIAPVVEAGQVYLPDRSIAPWIEDFIEECAGFPNATHDDQVDAMTQALLRLTAGGVVFAEAGGQTTDWNQLYAAHAVQHIESPWGI